MITLLETLQENMNNSSPKTNIPLYISNITESLLDTAHQMFTYLTNCPDTDVSYWLNWYVDMFTSSSPRTILQNIVSIINEAAFDNKKEYFVATKLFDHLEIVLNLYYRTIDMALSTETKLVRNPMMKQFFDDVGKCVDNINTNVTTGGKCKTEREKTAEIGSLHLTLHCRKM